MSGEEMKMDSPGGESIISLIVKYSYLFLTHNWR